MSYSQALEAAGAKVLAFEEFGSYQGDWWAKVQLGDKTGWINGSYGSCTGCDAFQAEFGYGWYDYDKNCDGDDPKHPRHNEYMGKLKDFGIGYLDNILSQDEAVKEASRNLDWDHDAEAMVKFLQNNPI